MSSYKKIFLILKMLISILLVYFKKWQREVEYQINSFLCVFLVSFCSFYSCFKIFFVAHATNFVALVGNVCSNKIYVPISFLKNKS